MIEHLLHLQLCAVLHVWHNTYLSMTHCNQVTMSTKATQNQFKYNKKILILKQTLITAKLKWKLFLHLVVHHLLQLCTTLHLQLLMNVLVAIQHWCKRIAVLYKQKQNCINFWSWKCVLALSNSCIWLTVVQSIVFSMLILQHNANYRCYTALA